MLLEEVGKQLVLRDVPLPQAKDNELLIKVLSCGVCRTDLHIIDGELTEPKLPLILGHQVVGVIESLGALSSKHKIGDRVGVPWLCEACRKCEYCQSGRENLCDNAIFMGYKRDGGYAEYCTCHEDFVFSLPDSYDNIHAAPLLCSGLIGYRALKLAGKAKTLGFYGFGSSAHLLIQVAKQLGQEVYVFTKPGDNAGQVFAKSLGAIWAGDSNVGPPELLDAAIIFAPVGSLYIEALKSLKKGGRVVSAGISMSQIPSFSYDLLWHEKSMTSVANLTRQDGIEFMEIAKNIPIHVSTNVFPLEQANEAINAIRKGSINGSAVLVIH